MSRRMTQDAINQALQLANQNRIAGRLAEAQVICSQVLSQQPNHPDALHLLGVINAQAHNLDAAIELMGRAIAINPNAAHCHSDMGNALRGKGILDQALAAFQRAITLAPNFAQAHINMGITLKDMGRYEEAVAAFRRCVQLQPNLAEAYSELGQTLREMGRFEEAVAACRQAVRLKPDYVDPRNNLGNTYRDMGQIDLAIDSYRQAIARQPDWAASHGNLLLVLHCYEKFDPNQQLAESIRWAARHADPLTKSAPPHVNNRSPDRRLKVGYVSPDFRGHPVGRFFLPLLAKHDPGQVEVFCYAQLGYPDAITLRIHQLAHQWRNTVGLNHDQVAQQIRSDQIDILVDLAGHTARNRLLVFARKPAPVQVSWLGYPSTTGMAAMDYRLTDALADPPGVSDEFCRERLIRLPQCAWCFEAPQETPPPMDNAQANGRPITFCSFNDFSKVNPPMLKLWARIILSTPGSRLLLKANAFSSGEAQDRVRKIMSAAGVGPDRLVLQGRRISYEDHLAAYYEADIGLDTFPYNGTTTTCEALWMGVPVITMAGTAHVSRVGLSLLSNVGLGELIADGTEQYVQMAIALAGDAQRLAALKAGLRDRMLNSPLMDARRFAGDIEAAYRGMWRSWCQSVA